MLKRILFTASGLAYAPMSTNRPKSMIFETWHQSGKAVPNKMLPQLQVHSDSSATAGLGTLYDLAGGRQISGWTLLKARVEQT